MAFCGIKAVSGSKVRRALAYGQAPDPMGGIVSSPKIYRPEALGQRAVNETGVEQPRDRTTFLAFSAASWSAASALGIFALTSSLTSVTVQPASSFQRHGGVGLDGLRGHAGASELGRERHGEAARVRRGDEAPLGWSRPVLKPRRESVLSVGQQAAFRRNLSLTVLILRATPPMPFFA